MEIIIGALLVALIFTAIISFGYEGERGWGALFMFFLLIFFPLWALAIWIPPVGPLYAGIAWFDFLFIALLITFFILALTPSDYYNQRRGNRSGRNTRVGNAEFVGNEATMENHETARAFSAVFWVFIGLLAIAIALGTLRY